MSHKQHPKINLEERLTGRSASDTAPQRSHAKLPNSEHTKDEAGVCEAYAGIIESSDIDPLHHESAKGDRSSKGGASAALETGR